ncbi:MAG: response regulator [bacterium]|nr:response regulator [bacterium]
MLVLSRRAGETIHLPTVEAVFEVVQINGNQVRIGVQAPRSMPIMRGELLESDKRLPSVRSIDVKALREEKHALRNRLNTVSLGVTLAKKQLELGRHAEAIQAMNMVLSAVEKSNNDTPAPPSDQVIRALVVEDDANEQKLLATYLKTSGLEVETANNGREAIEYLDVRTAPHIILMDMMMPDCDGPTAIDQIRQRPGGDMVKIFAMSGKHQSEFHFDARVDQWFHKPLDPEELLGRIARELIPVAAST